MNATTSNSKRKLAIVNIGQLVTLAGPARPRVGPEMRELGLLQNAAILVEGGRIAQVGKYEDLRDRIDESTEVVDAQGRLVTPGFVDAHTHLVFAGNRAAEFEQRIAGATYQEIAAAGGGIQSTVALTRKATEDELLVEARLHRSWMLRDGSTTIEAKSGYGLNRETELRMLRVIARLNQDGPVRVIPTLLAAHTVPKEMAERREEYIRWVAEECIPEVAQLGLARYCDAFCDDHAFTVAETRLILQSAKRHGLGLRLHAEQFRPGTGAALAAELGATTVDHLETVTDETLKLLLAASVQPVLLPASVFCLGREQYPPARTMIDLGLPVVLATDFNPGSSPSPSMRFIMSLASIQMKMLPSESLVAATINAACSLGLGSEVGSLESGKRADLLLHEYNDYRELAYFAATAERTRVFISGQEVTL
jgi:imidazolonepropionase